MAFSYSPKIVTDGLVFAVDAANKKSYPGSGTTWTDLAGNNNGTLTNGPTFDSGNGGSIVFDGSDDYVEFSNTNILNTSNPFTISFWVNMITMPNSITSPIVIKTNANDFLILISARSGYVGIAIGSGLTWAQGRTETSSDFFINKWVNVCITYNGNAAGTLSNFQIFENNNNRSITSGTSGLLSQSTQTRIGYINSGNTLNGKIAKFMIYNKALSSTEITQNYNALKSRFGL